jgi:hypothetical protein
MKKYIKASLSYIITVGTYDNVKKELVPWKLESTVWNIKFPE